MDAVNGVSSFAILICATCAFTPQHGALLAILWFQEMKTYAEI
jgi:hypothetical protein